MKARFFMKTPPDGGEPVEYVEIDPDDTGKNIVGRQASDEDRSRFSAEYEAFEKDQEEREAKGEPAMDAVPPSLGVPVTVKAAAPLGREEEFTQQWTNPGKAAAAVAPAQTVGTMKVAKMVVGEEGEEGEDPNAPEATAISDMNADEAITEVRASNDKQQLQTWRREEKSGKSRVTVLEQIDHRLSQL